MSSSRSRAAPVGPTPDADSRPDGRPPSAAGPEFSPLYRQVKTLMTRDLQLGVWRPGDAIPSETELALRFKVSQGTVRKAIDELASDNLLVRRQGKGTFVATHAEEKVQFRFLRLTPDEGETGAMTRRFIDCRRRRAPADVAAALRLGGAAASIRVRRLLSLRGAPVVLDDIWLPAALFEGLTAEKLAGHQGPLYGFFEAEFGVRMIRATEQVRAVAADASSAEWLGVAPGAPLLDVERLAFTYEDQPVELRRGLYQTAKHYYRNELS